MSVKKRLVWIPILLGLLAGCGADAQRADGGIYVPEQQPESAVNYTTLLLEPQDIAKDSEMSVSPVYDITVDLTAEEDLELVEFLTERGASVEKGAPLVRLTRNASQADVLEAQLKLDRTAEQQNEAVAKLEGQLAQKKAGSSEYALLQLELEEVQTRNAWELEECRQALENAEARLEDVVLYAPFDGVITAVSALSEGAKAEAGTVLLTVSKSDSLVLVGTSGAGFFQYGMDVTVEYGKGNSKKTASGRVAATDAVLGNAFPKNDQVVIRLDDQDISAEDLEKATAAVHTVQLTGALLVPKSAVKTENGQSYVSILEGDTVQKRYILTGITAGNPGSYQMQVLSGLEFGQYLVLD